jgi:hypothetical protein
VQGEHAAQMGTRHNAQLLHLLVLAVVRLVDRHRAQ